jgi:hypothetical protein
MESSNNTIDIKDVDPDKIKMLGQEEQESKDYTLKAVKPSDDPDDAETPQYQQAIELTEDQTDRLLEAAICEFKAIKQERDELHLEERWMMLQNQYDGIMEENQDQQFSLHMHTTKIKIDAIVRAAKTSFFDSDPKFAITPQPGYAAKDSRGADEVCQQQQDFLDFEISQELNLEGPFEMALYSSAIKGVGILKFPWKYRREKRQREECYEGKFVVQGIVQGKAIVRNPGLELFVQNYPDAKTRYPDLYEKVKSGKTIYVQAKYNDIVYNNPDPQYIENENFYVYDFVDGLKGIKSARCIAERQLYTWNELREMEYCEGWSHIDSMRFPGSVRNDTYKQMTEAQRKESDKEFKDADTRKYPVIEQTYFFNLKDTGDIEDEVKVKFWWSEDREVLLHCQHYPYENISTEYIPIYMRRIRPGFWQDGMSIASDLSDSNLAENALINFMLEMAWIETTVTPVIKEGSPAEKQIMTRRWNHGVPLVIKKDASEVSKEIMFLQKPQSQAAGMIPIIQYLLQQDDNVTGVSSLMTGRESPTDPRAPAIKTMALLKQSGLNIESYVKTALPSFNEIAVILLALYYQMTEDSKAFLTRKTVQDLTNSDPFKRISRQQMIAKTNIKSQAYAFALDKIQEKQENIALYSVLRTEIAARGDAESLDNLVRSLVESWSPQWKTRVGLVWPTLSEFKQRQLQMAAKGCAAYITQLKQQEQVSGVPAQADAQKLVALLGQLQQMSMASPEDQQKMAKQANGGS